MLLQDNVLNFISVLTALKPQVDSVWLIGSRANERATEKSDTDLIVFGSEALIDAMRTVLDSPNDIDCLVVFDGDNYRDPWQDKIGSLSELNWKQGDDKLASYQGTKFIQDVESSKEYGIEIGNVEQLNEKAVRVWP